MGFIRFIEMLHVCLWRCLERIYYWHMFWRGLYSIGYNRIASPSPPPNPPYQPQAGLIGIQKRQECLARVAYPFQNQLYHRELKRFYFSRLP